MNLLKLGVVLVFVGMILAVIAALLQALGEVSAPSKGNVIICVIPICFGVGEHALPAIVIALVLTIVLIIVSLVFVTYAHRRIGETVLHNAIT